MREQKLTGYPSIDKPWLKYYPKEAIDTPLPECSAYEIIFNNNRDNLKRVAIDYYGTKITYQALFEHVDRVAAALVTHGVRRGDIVSLCMLNSVETIYLIYALNKIGAVSNLICGLDSDRELIAHLQNSTSPLLFTLDIFVSRIINVLDQTELEKIVVLNLTQGMSAITRFAARKFKGMQPKTLPLDSRFISWKEFVTHRGPIKMGTTVSEANIPAVICYTGGTTGGSKGVVLSNKNMVAVAQQYIWRGPQISRNSRWAEVLPLFIAYGVACALQIPLMVGMTIVLRITGSMTIGNLCKLKPQYIVYGPAFWEQFADENTHLDLSFLTECISGGDRLPAPIEEKINNYLAKCGCKSPILNGYGMSEVSAAVSVNFEGAHEPGSVGIPFVKTVISAFDVETGVELPTGNEGEICIHGPSVMMEYINNPEETQNLMRVHTDGLKWVHSGDLGFIDEKGFVHISGRLKRYILTKYNGLYKKVFSLDIEKVLLSHPAVSNCAVVPIPDSENEQVPASFIILKQDAAASDELLQSIQQHCKSNLDPIYWPKKFLLCEEFPLTKIGKVDYRALETLAAQENEVKS